MLEVQAEVQVTEVAEWFGVSRQAVRRGVGGTGMCAWPATYDEAVLDRGFLADRGVAFPVFDAEPTISGEPSWNGWMETSSSAAIAVSLVRGTDPSDPDAEVTGNETGMVVWSFDPRQLQGDSWWPAHHASLFLGLQFAHRRGITLREGSRQLYDALNQAGEPTEVMVDGQVVLGSLYELPPVGSVVSAVTSTFAFAAAFFLTPPTTSFRSIAR